MSTAQPAVGAVFDEHRPPGRRRAAIRRSSKNAAKTAAQALPKVADRWPPACKRVLRRPEFLDRRHSPGCSLLALQESLEIERPALNNLDRWLDTPQAAGGRIASGSWCRCGRHSPRRMAAERGEPALSRTHRLPEPHALAAGQVLDELPGDAAGAAAARRRPFERLRLPFRLRRPGRGNARYSRRTIARNSSWLQLWKPSQRPKRSDSDTFSCTASDGLIAVERSFSIMSRGRRWRRLEVA